MKSRARDEAAAFSRGDKIPKVASSGSDVGDFVARKMKAVSIGLKCVRKAAGFLASRR